MSQYHDEHSGYVISRLLMAWYSSLSVAWALLRAILLKILKTIIIFLQSLNIASDISFEAGLSYTAHVVSYCRCDLKPYSVLGQTQARQYFNLSVTRPRQVSREQNIVTSKEKKNPNTKMPT